MSFTPKPDDFVCECGAKAPHVGVIRSRLKSPFGPYAVGCTRCGRVGQHAMTPQSALEHWQAHDYLFGPAKPASCPVCGSRINASSNKEDK